MYDHALMHLTFTVSFSNTSSSQLKINDYNCFEKAEMQLDELFESLINL